MPNAGVVGTHEGADHTRRPANCRKVVPRGMFTTTTAAVAIAKPTAVTAVNDSPNSTAPQTAVVGAIRNIRELTRVTPIFSTRYQYKP
ncbi:hypothetical protein NWFMUON74_15540 [Nocardia wallacei]|uniref:Uncharacterized protein n=1 Tax=Nocardia wallacei TaxID=480035 RepID=A0A7G1KEU9_9NOCA|nr:hypothetical protein NWFMUON74_15540 [Nocardia wallacei]